LPKPLDSSINPFGQKQLLKALIVSVGTRITDAIAISCLYEKIGIGLTKKTDVKNRKTVPAIMYINASSI